MRRAVWALLISVPVVLLLGSGFGRDPGVIVSPLLNRPAPGFALRSVDGRPVSLGSLRGRPVVLNFWASWCPSCRDEHGLLLAAWRRYGRRVAFVGVGFRDTSTDLRAFMRQYGGGWPVVLDPGAETAMNYGVAGPPETFFIDSRGVGRAKAVGPVSASLLTREMSVLLGGRT